MRDYEEKSYYEIQLDNKQLILVFLAGVTVCVLVFILGVMVGKGQKEAEIAAIPRGAAAREKAATDTAAPSEIQPVSEEETPRDKGGRKTKKEKPIEQASPSSATEELAYTKLDKSDSETPLTPTPEPVKPEPPKKSSAVPEETVTAAAPAAANGTRYTVQVMATGSKEKADQQLNYLKSKGYTAFMSEEKTGSGASVFKVRVGKFADSDSAKKIATRLKQDLKLETWVAVLE